jgi:hypothetical protein
VGTNAERKEIDKMAKKEVWYRQCRMERRHDLGTSWDVAWIPEALAKVGKLVYLTETPDEIYTITLVGTSRRSQAEAHAKVMQQRNYHKTTDI